LQTDETAVAVAKSIADGEELTAEVTRIDALVQFVERTEQAIRSEIRGQSEAILAEVTGDIQRMWAILHPEDRIDNIRLVLPDADKSIDIALTFHGVELESPRITLSEGYRNSLGLCIFLAMAVRGDIADRPLVLDDVIVSLDRNHRGMVARLLKEEFADRQVLVFTHDRDWYSDLRAHLPQRDWVSRTLMRYGGPETGIRFDQPGGDFAIARADVADRPGAAATEARKIMDMQMRIVAERTRATARATSLY